MKLQEYLDVNKLESYIDQKLVDVNYHDTLPLVIYKYGRKAVHEQVWDEITTKCRGLIVDKSNNEILARPFNKFFNFETGYRPETQLANLPLTSPQVLEKLDGFMLTLYQYNGQHYIASKGSFHSVHAKWGTQWYNTHVVSGVWPDGYTAVFEGISSKVQRIVVNYDYEGLVLLGLINNETGEELDYNTLFYYAQLNGVRLPKIHAFTLDDVRNKTLQEHKNEEGYVLVWPKTGQTPLRVKVKFTEYLRLHRLITGITPKHILECLTEPYLAASLDEYLNDSTPEFKEFVQKWVLTLNTEYARVYNEAIKIFMAAAVNVPPLPIRKDYAVWFTKPEHKEYSSILFAWLDGNNDAATRIIWKHCQKLTKFSQSLYTEIE